MRFGFLSDAHGNIEAFDQGLSLLEAQRCDRIFFLGDSIGYLSGDAVVRRIAAEQIEPLRGNHEDMVIRNAVPPEREAIYSLKKTRDDMSDQNLTTMTGWPSERRIETDGGQLLLVHGSPRDPINGYIYPDTPIDQFATVGIKAIFCGHTHRPFIGRCNDTLLVNVGSVGLPRDDGRFGAVALYEPESGQAEILRFDITVATERALSRCGLVHPSVIDLLGRRAERPVGTFI